MPFDKKAVQNVNYDYLALRRQTLAGQVRHGSKNIDGAEDKLGVDD